MHPANTALRSCFTRDSSGNINYIILDDLQIFAQKSLPVPLYSLFTDDNQQEAKKFWKALNESSGIFDQAININTYFNFKNTRITAIKTESAVPIFISHVVSSMDSNGTSPATGAASTGQLVKDETVYYESELMKRNLLIESLRRTIESNDQKFRILSGAINDAIRDWNIVNDSIVWNQRVSAIYGYTEKEAPVNFESWSSNIHADDREDVLKGLKDTLNDGKLNWKFL